MRGDEELIDRGADEGTRDVALALLADADGAVRALARDEGDEALHDFRVALRRLRSALRAFRPWLEDGVGKKHERRLKRLARATNAARDAEVQLAWLESERETLAAGRCRPGLELLTARLEERRREGSDDRGRLLSRYRRASSRLRRRLARYEVRLDGATRVPFSAAMAGLLSDQLEMLRERLGAIRDASDEGRVHRARIAAKRLRYELETLRASRAVDPRPAVKHLKQLQDVLGELHDAHVLAAEVASAAAEVSADRTRRLVRAGGRLRRELRDSPRPGLLAAGRRLRERRDALYAALERDWRGGGLEALAADVTALTSALEARAGGALDRRRRFVLAAFPVALADIGPREIDEGWLPGARLREWVRRERGPGGERFRRGLERGRGKWALATEEETSREVFEALWPVTERRSTRRRWEIADGGVTWTVEQQPGRDEWVAEALLPAQGDDVAAPDWLAPVLAREAAAEPAPTGAERTAPPQPGG